MHILVMPQAHQARFLSLSLTPLHYVPNRTRRSLKAGIGVTNASQLQIKRRCRLHKHPACHHKRLYTRPHTNITPLLATRPARPSAAPDTALLARTTQRPFNHQHAQFNPHLSTLSYRVCCAATPDQGDQTKKESIGGRKPGLSLYLHARDTAGST